MPSIAVQATAATPIRPPEATPQAWRIRFVQGPAAGQTVRREFRQVRPCVAVDEAVTCEELLTARSKPNPTDYFEVVFVPRGAAVRWHEMGRNWLAAGDQCVVANTTPTRWRGLKVEWRAGRVLVEGPGECPDELLTCLVAFAFYEGELRVLEEALETYETEAPGDVTHAHRIRFSDRKRWRRFGERIESCAQLRLTFARLAPRLGNASHTLPRDARRFMARLRGRAGVSARLEAFSDRLEACEDLYEGANDRVTDYRWYFRGMWLELGIIALLLIEVALLGTDLYMRYLEYQVE